MKLHLKHLELIKKNYSEFSSIFKFERKLLSFYASQNQRKKFRENNIKD